MPDLKQLLDQFIERGVLTREDHDMLIDTISADGQVDSEERAQISRMFQLIREGKLRVVDDAREASDKAKKDELKKTLQEKLKSR